MRSAAALAGLVLAGCASEGAVPVHGVSPGHRCVANGTETFIGQTGTGETGAGILRATHAAILRWAPIGTMLTMDYREDRVTVRLGPDRRVTAVTCG